MLMDTQHIIRRRSEPRISEGFRTGSPGTSAESKGRKSRGRLADGSGSYRTVLGRCDSSHSDTFRLELTPDSATAEWYLHLSSSFLSARAAKLLVLAGQERLDRELMVGQMWVSPRRYWYPELTMWDG